VQQQQQQQQQQGGGGSGLGLRTGSSGGGSSKFGLNHSATAAARLGREASFKAANAETAALSRSNSRGVQVSEATATLQQQQQQQQQQQVEEHHMLAVQFAAASAQLASALATARQVLADLVLGASPNAQQQAALEAGLNGLDLEEALSELVYQVS
jgi:hypothetical protein